LLDQEYAVIYFQLFEELGFYCRSNRSVPIGQILGQRRRVLIRIGAAAPRPWSAAPTSSATMQKAPGATYINLRRVFGYRGLIYIWLGDFLNTSIVP
jgi:hypothetical protein